MRVGFNPHKDQIQEKQDYLHQVVLPVFIPNQEDYFADSFKILKLCLNSLFATVHERTFITVVNNGSEPSIVAYLDTLYQEKKIHELIHTKNIGKLNAILKGLSGNNIELVTIADSDVLFLSNWQIETNRVFEAFPKAGVVGIVPQYKGFTTKCHNLLWDYLWNDKLRFIPVKNPEAISQFYTSIGWDKSNPDYLKQALGLIGPNDFKAYVGAGHFVATYKKDMFEKMVTFIGYKMGGDSEQYLDAIPLKKDYWRLTTYDNHAYHMGNVFEDWMATIEVSLDNTAVFKSNFPTFKKLNRYSYFLKNDLFRKIFKNKRVKRWFYGLKKLPKEMISNY